MKDSIWSLIKNTRDNNSKAIDEMTDCFRPAIEHFIKSKGFSDLKAQDMAQRVFSTILQDDVLEDAEQTRSRFRSIILGATKHVMLQELRKKDAQTQIDTLNLHDLLFLDDRDNEVFDRLWFQNLVTHALERLKLESAQKGHGYYQILSMNIDDGSSLKDIARKLGKSVVEIKESIYRARVKLTQFVRDEIMGYISSKDEFDNEVNLLLKLSI